MRCANSRTRPGVAAAPPDLPSRRSTSLQLEYTSLGQYCCDFRQIGLRAFRARHLLPIDRTRARRHARRRQEHRRPRTSICARCATNCGCCRASTAFKCAARKIATICSRSCRALKDRIDDNRAGIATARYEFRPGGREPDTMLFLGSFRHLPNQEGLAWFTRNVLPRVLERSPQARLVIVGAEPPPRHSLPHLPDNIELRGFVEDVREPLAPLRGLRLSDSQRIGNARETAGGVRRRHSGGLDAPRRRRPGGKRRRDLCAGRRSQPRSPTASSNCCVIPEPRAKWPAARASTWSPPATCGSSPSAW